MPLSNVLPGRMTFLNCALVIRVFRFALLARFFLGCKFVLSLLASLQFRPLFAGFQFGARPSAVQGLSTPRVSASVPVAPGYLVVVCGRLGIV